MESLKSLPCKKSSKRKSSKNSPSIDVRTKKTSSAHETIDHQIKEHGMLQQSNSTTDEPVVTYKDALQMLNTVKSFAMRKQNFVLYCKVYDCICLVRKEMIP